MSVKKAAIGELIRSERIAHGMTLDELCDGICSKRQLSNIESGRNVPGLYIVTRILARLEIDISDMPVDEFR